MRWSCTWDRAGGGGPQRTPALELRFPLSLFHPGVKTITLAILSCSCSQNLPSRREGISIFCHLGSMSLIPGAEGDTSPPGEVRTLVPNLSASQSGSGGVSGLLLCGPAALQPPPAAKRQSSDFSKALEPDKAQLRL